MNFVPFHKPVKNENLDRHNEEHKRHEPIQTFLLTPAQILRKHFEEGRHRDIAEWLHDRRGQLQQDVPLDLAIGSLRMTLWPNLTVPQIDYVARQILFGPVPELANSLPLRLLAGLPVVEAKVDHVSAHLMVDTGASSLVLFEPSAPKPMRVSEVRPTPGTIGEFERR